MPRAVLRALESDDDLDTLADPCGNNEFRDDVTAHFLLPVITDPSTTTTTTAATTTTESLNYWGNQNYGHNDQVVYPWGVPTTRVDSLWRQIPTTSTPRELSVLRSQKGDSV